MISGERYWTVDIGSCWWRDRTLLKAFWGALLSACRLRDPDRFVSQDKKG